MTDATSNEPETPVPKSQRRRGQILLLGDSLTQQSFSASLSGWGAHLADLYQRRADVYNRGMSGYNTDWYLLFLDTPEGQADVLSSSYSNVGVVTICFGANDASSPDLNPRHHVPLDRFQDNLKRLAQRVEKVHPQARIVFLTCPPVHHESRLQYQIQRYGKGATGRLERTLERSGRYADACQAVAQELQCPCLNLWKEMQEASPNHWQQFLSDGLHFSRAGNEWVGRRVAEMISQHCGEWSVTPDVATGFSGNSASTCGPQLCQMGPWHDEIDASKAADAFGTTRTPTK